MFTLLIIFITAVCAGLGFWFYNRRQVTSLSEQIEDKNAVINAFRNHVETSSETEVQVQSNFSRNTLNDEWRVSTNLTPTVEEALQNKPKKKKQKQKTQMSSQQKTSQNPNQKQKKNSEKKSNQKPPKFVV